MNLRLIVENKQHLFSTNCINKILKSKLLKVNKFEYKYLYKQVGVENRSKTRGVGSRE